MESEKVLKKLDTAFISVQGFDDFKPTEHNIQVMAVTLGALKTAYNYIMENREVIDKINEIGESAVPVQKVPNAEKPQDSEAAPQISP